MPSTFVDLGQDLDLSFSESFVVREESYQALRTSVRAAPLAILEPLQSFSADADEYQLRVIAARSKTIRLVAPAGSGKTQTMVNRVLTRIRDGLTPERILMLTFDRSAAAAIQDKLRESVGAIEELSGQPLNLHSLTITTLNSFGYGVLKEFAPELSGRVVKPSYQQRLIRDGLSNLRELSLERHRLLPSYLRRSYYLDAFSFFKNQLQDPRQLNTQVLADLILDSKQTRPLFEEEVTIEQTKHIVQAVIFLYQFYDRGLMQSGVLDFDDQKLRTHVFLRDNPELCNRVQNRYDEIVIDEFQDINKLDFELIRQVSANATLLVTGDDDQAIYGFRGCTPDYIIDLDRYLGRPVEGFELSRNYRCPPNIVNHADQLIRNNQRRIPKNPVAAKLENSVINVLPSLSANLEARLITDTISRSVAQDQRVGYADIAVLYRTNAQSLPIQINFILANIPYNVRDEDNLLENESLERLLGALRAKLAVAAGSLPSPDDQALVYEAFFPRMSERDSAGLRQLARSGVSLLDYRGAAEVVKVLPWASQSSVLDAFDELARTPLLLNELDVLRRRFRGLQGMVGSLEDVVDRPSALAEIFDIARDFNGETARFASTLERVIKRARDTGAGKDESGIALLTYFRSKGRQWHTVFLTSCNDGLIPHAKAPVEDERRLFYVALTRASANLIVSYVENALDLRVRPSRFLKEAGLMR